MHNKFSQPRLPDPPAHAAPSRTPHRPPLITPVAGALRVLPGRPRLPQASRPCPRPPLPRRPARAPRLPQRPRRPPPDRPQACPAAAAPGAVPPRALGWGPYLTAPAVPLRAPLDGDQLREVCGPELLRSSRRRGRGRRAGRTNNNLGPRRRRSRRAYYPSPRVASNVHPPPPSHPNGPLRRPQLAPGSNNRPCKRHPRGFLRRRNRRRRRCRSR